MTATLLFPNTLCKEIPDGNSHIFLVEHPIFFTNQTKNRPRAKLNRLRCAYHRVTEDLWVRDRIKSTKNPEKVCWCRLKQVNKVPWPTQKQLKGVKTVQVYDPTDDDLLQEIQSWAKRHKLTLEVLESPLFLFSKDQLKNYRDSKQNDVKKIYRHASFYSWARKQTECLITDAGKMEGGKLSFDAKNREPISQEETKKIPKPWEWRTTGPIKNLVHEAWDWACEMFPDHHGPPTNDKNETIVKLLKPFALTTKHAEAALANFVKHRLPKFGTYEDAVPLPSESTFVYHSNLSHCLNNGLLHPKRVVDEVQEWYYSNQSPECLAQAEGCIRQVLGWREFTRMAAAWDREWLWESNGLNAEEPLTSAWYSGSVGSPPVDSTIQKAFQRGYLHHIERLMIMGNYMTLSQIHPQQMYQWFMEFAMDSYDWVMILNVFGMAAHADLGTTFTKPYVSSSNYITKMTHYPREAKWTKEWDTLYYQFLDRHKQRFSSNQRMVFMMKHLGSKKAQQLLKYALK